MRFSSDFGVEASDWTRRFFYNYNCSKSNKSASSFRKSSANWTFVKRVNYLFEFRHDSIKHLLLQKCSTSFYWIKSAQRSIGRNNFNNKHHNCSISSTSFSICTYPVNLKKLPKNYETLHKLVFLGKLSWMAIKKPAESTISRPLLREVT